MNTEDKNTNGTDNTPPAGADGTTNTTTTDLTTTTEEKKEETAADPKPVYIGYRNEPGFYLVKNREENGRLFYQSVFGKQTASVFTADEAKAYIEKAKNEELVIIEE